MASSCNRWARGGLWLRQRGQVRQVRPRSCAMSPPGGSRSFRRAHGSLRPAAPVYREAPCLPACFSSAWPWFRRRSWSRSPVERDASRRGVRGAARPGERCSASRGWWSPRMAASCTRRFATAALWRRSGAIAGPGLCVNWPGAMAASGERRGTVVGAPATSAELERSRSAPAGGRSTSRAPGAGRAGAGPAQRGVATAGRPAGLRQRIRTARLRRGTSGCGRALGGGGAGGPLRLPAWAQRCGCGLPARSADGRRPSAHRRARVRA